MDSRESGHLRSTHQVLFRPYPLHWRGARVHPLSCPLTRHDHGNNSLRVRSVILDGFWAIKIPAPGRLLQRSPNPHPHLSRSNGGHPHQEGRNLGVCVPVWLVLPRCEATNLGVFDLPYSNGAVQIWVVWSSLALSRGARRIRGCCRHLQMILLGFYFRESLNGGSQMGA